MVFNEDEMLFLDKFIQIETNLPISLAKLQAERVLGLPLEDTIREIEEIQMLVEEIVENLEGEALDLAIEKATYIESLIADILQAMGRDAEEM